MDTDCTHLIIFYLQDDVTRFWREEKENGAIYNVYLKKVTYHTLSDVSTDLKKISGQVMSS